MQYPQAYGGGPPRPGPFARPLFPSQGGMPMNGPPQGSMPFGGRVGPPVRPQLIVRPIGGTATPSLGPVIKKTTLYVGKIAASVEDVTIEQLLQACGALRSWKHMRDPDTSKSKGFGFAEFEEAEGVIRAMRILHNLELDGQAVMVKPDSATQRYLNDYTAQQTEQSRAEDNDDEALAKVMEIVSTLAADKAAAAAVAAADKAAKDFLANAIPAEGTTSKGDGGASPSRVSEGSRRARSSERDRDVERDRERDRRSREERSASDRAYRDRLAAWERQERERAKAHEADREREKRQEQDRARLIKTDLLGEPEPEEIWKRKPYRGSRRAEERKRRREREEAEDNEDREREREEKKRKLEVLATLKEVPEPKVNGVDIAIPTPTPTPTPLPVNADDPIYQAMMAAAKEPPKPVLAPVAETPAPAVEHEAESLPPPPLHLKQEGPVQREGLVVAPGVKPAAAAPVQSSTKGKSRQALAAFADDEEDQPRRAPKPIQYTEEEIRAVQNAAPRTADATGDVKSIADSIPTARDAVFAYAVDWDSYDAAGDKLVQKLMGWVNGKVKELLGEEEPTLVSFVVNKMKEHSAANDMLAEMKEVLDDEADGFVLKLYRFVIFETKKFAMLGGS